VAFSPDGKELISTGDDGTLRQWDPFQQKPIRTIDAARKPKQWVSYSRDGRELISSEEGGTLRVWDRSTGKEIRAIQIGESFAYQPALSPDGRYLVAGVDNSIVLLEYPSLKIKRRFPRSPVYGHSIAFSSDGRTIATWGESNRVHLSTLDGTTLGSFDHSADVLSVDFSPDGRILATGDMNHEIHVWDVHRLQKRATLRGHDHWVEKVRFSPDGKTIASTSDDGTVRLWRSAPPD
jgi:WD40 repeat protein